VRGWPSSCRPKVRHRSCAYYRSVRAPRLQGFDSAILGCLQGAGHDPVHEVHPAFELTKLVENVSEYLGAGRGVPEREISKIEEVERVVGKAEDILDRSPSPRTCAGT